ncbi:hypothetical protein KAM622c_56360 (plasmid) [Klebsiella quasipneumoniae subsp. quasipneumoniae]|nr:hypothetical protein KAM622c_56360 [Klebsiella quasipneumoniae subsp. quasipneumoniae]
MAELLKSESPVSPSVQDITEALKIVVDDGSKAAKLVCLNERNELVPLLTQNSFVPDFRVRHEGLNPLMGWKGFRITANLVTHWNRLMYLTNTMKLAG